MLKKNGWQHSNKNHLKFYGISILVHYTHYIHFNQKLCNTNIEIQQQKIGDASPLHYAIFEETQDARTPICIGGIYSLILHSMLRVQTKILKLKAKEGCKVKGKTQLLILA